jgi:hypothetical protein
MVENINTSNI